MRCIVKHISRFIYCLSFIILSSCTSVSVSTVDSRVVLTSVAPIFQITKALLENTNVNVQNIPQKPRTLAAQTTFFSRQGERFTEQFNAADAVITIGKIWPEDSFYTTAREANIRIINIDASKPWSHAKTGVTVVNSSVSGEVLPFFWVSPTNSIRMLNIIAHDLQRLYPDQANIIAQNLLIEKRTLTTIIADFETKFIEVPDPLVYALADEFSYLTNELGIFVEDYFIKQDIDWTEEDLNNLTRRLQSSGVKVVLHKWQPSTAIKAAIEAADSQLVVLDLQETSTENFTQTLTNNLRLILMALSQ